MACHILVRMNSLDDWSSILDVIGVECAGNTFAFAMLFDYYIVPIHIKG